MKKLFSLSLALVLVLALLAGCGQKTTSSSATGGTSAGGTASASATGEDTSKSDLLVTYVGSRLGDNSTSDAIWAGLEKAKADFGIQIKMIEIHPTDNSKYKAAVLEACDSDAQLIIGNAGSGLIDDMTAVAADYPDKFFMCLDAPTDNAEIPELDNFVGMMAKQNECSYLVGYLAGKMTESGTIGGIVGVEYPVLQDFFVGYISGALQANPDVKVATAAIGDFVDTAKAKEIALTQYRSGCDIVYAIAGPASYGILEASAEADKWAIGVDVDMTLSVDEATAKHILTSAIKDWGYLTYHTIDRFVNDRASIEWSKVEVYGIANGGATFIQNDIYKNTVPADIQKEMDQLVKDVTDGKLVVPTIFDMSEEEYAALKDKVKLA